MSQFQTQSQSQWENESDIIIADETEAEIGSNKNTRKKVYIVLIGVFLTALLTVFSIYHFARPIEGIWVRQADDHVGAEGMTVEVIQSGEFYEGKVMSDSDDSTKFKEGQIKWYKMRKVGFGVYECYDLSLYEEDNTYDYTGVISTITVQPGGKSLIIDAPIVERGAHQLWIKQEKG